MARKHPTTRPHRRPQFEELEPRILYSADFVPIADGAVEVCVDDSVDTAEAMPDYPILSEEEIYSYPSVQPHSQPPDNGQSTQPESAETKPLENQQETRTELVFINGDVPNAEQLLEQLQTTDIHEHPYFLIDLSEDGWEQLLNTASQFDDIEHPLTGRVHRNRGCAANPVGLGRHLAGRQRRLSRRHGLPHLGRQHRPNRACVGRE